MIKVFIIDDSMLIRNIIHKILKDNRIIEIIGEASNPIDAMKEFKTTGLPDVFILDIEMPKMDGLSFLKKLHDEKPIPTLIFSSLVNEGSSKAMEALEYGACDVVLKPQKLNDALSNDFTEDMIRKVKAAAHSKYVKQVVKKTNSSSTRIRNSEKIIAIGASTGGVQTIESILVNLHPSHPPIVITQHMPAGFTYSFANRLNKTCQHSTIKEAEDGDILEEGCVYIAPGDLHLEVKLNDNRRYMCVLKNYPKVSNHKPSVDVLFKSMSKMVKSDTVAFLLTGMGRDGANGLKLIKDAGGYTYGQDEASSIVYGMPKVAYEQGYVNKQVNINEVVTVINEME